jgi:hypothetical protein
MVNTKRIWRITVGFLWILVANRLTVALEVFHGVEKALSLLTWNHTTCLSTDALLLSDPRRNVYPLDLFGETSFPSDSHSCFFQNSYLREETHSCSHSHYICPVKEKYIRIAMTGFENASSQICHTFKALEEETGEEADTNGQTPPPVNVFLIGGSVTGGVAVAGCTEGFCSHETDAPCVQFDCAWPKSIMNYLRNRFEKKNKKSQINLIDLAAGATTSCSLLHTLVQKLEARNATVSSRDILLYDYSVNDGTIYHDAKQLQQLKHCLEGVLEKLVHYSQDHSPPTVILLEFYPFKAFEINRQTGDPDCYTKVYHDVASEFHLPIISFFDLQWHPLFREDLKQYPKLEYIMQYKWAKPAVPGGYWVDIHPPWLVHDIYADVIAGALEGALHLCNHNHAHRNHNNKSGTIIEIDVDPWKAFRESSTGSNNLVVINEEATVANAPFLTHEEIRALPYGWKLYQDRRGKPGWIIEGNNTVERPLNQRVLTFSGHYQSDSGSTTPPTPFSSLATLEVAYMQTYHHTGGFRVQVCDEFLETVPEQLSVVDTYINEPFTTLEVAVFKVDLNKKNSCHSENGFLLKVIHENIDDRLEERGTQKVKVTSVRLTVPK